MLSLPWSVVTALRLQPVGPVSPGVFGLRYVDGKHAGRYHVAEPRRLQEARDILGRHLLTCPLNAARQRVWAVVLGRFHRGVTE